MVYNTKYLPIRILFESSQEETLHSFFRPDAYLNKVGGFCTQCQIDSLHKEIKKGEEVILNATLRSPAGYGHGLKVGCMLILMDGVFEVGKAIVLEIDPSTSLR